MSENKRIFRSLCCVLLALCVLCSVSVPASAASLEELRQKQEDLEQQKADSDEKLIQLQEATEERRASRDAIYEKIDRLQDRLTLMRQRIEELDRQIALDEDEIAEKQEGLDRSMSLLGERIRALYLTGDASTLALILDSENLLDLTEKTEFLAAVTRHDRELIASLNEQVRDISADRDRLRESKDELCSRKKEMDASGAELTQLYEEAQKLLDDAENEELNCRTNSDLLGYAMKENEAAIAALEQEVYSQQAPASGGYVGTGSFAWPMPGYTYLTCYFGEGGHRGIDIAGANIYGQPIVAADGGSVIYAGWNDSYGYCVFIDHGNGYETRYAHMSELGTFTGAAVEQGQVIGYVGSTGNSTGPHLHFEVILGGSLTDPMGYF